MTEARSGGMPRPRHTCGVWRVAPATGSGTTTCLLLHSQRIRLLVHAARRDPPTPRPEDWKGERSTMSSNKKSSLTGYLPDIIMAMAAVSILPRAHVVHAARVDYHAVCLSNACIQPAIAYFIIRNLLARLDPDAQQKEEAKRKASAANRKLGAILSNKARDAYDSDSDDEYERRRRGDRPRIEDLNLTAYEQTIAMEVVAPEEIPVSFDGTYFLPTAFRLF